MTDVFGDVTVADCIKVACKRFNVTEIEIKSFRRDQRIARARQVVYWLARETTVKSYPQIGQMLSGRDHTTIMCGVTRVLTLREADREFRILTDLCKADLSAPVEAREPADPRQMDMRL